ncbi:MAG TPA: pitrilysin family protein [Thermoanaerobaculia bacterium]|jgi:zinc protease
MRQRLTYLLAFALTIPLAIPLYGASQLDVPSVAYRHRTLPNGMEVYSVRDTSIPRVAIQVWYRVGSKNDPPHRSGFAHLFEHIMFKSTKHMPSEFFDRLTEDVGGENNATTRDDSTNYYEVIPSNYLETLLWAEGERLASLTVNEANFKSERDVVKEEYRFRILAPPYGRLYYSLDKDSWQVHPYKRPGIGSIEDLDASTLSDVKKFHSTYYRPDNAVIVVAGDFDDAQLDGWVDKYLGTIPRPKTAIPRVTVKEPPHKELKRFTEYGPNVPLPAAAMTWIIPDARSADSAPLTVAAAVLGLGESSRAYQSLVYREKIANEVEIDADEREDAGLFIAFAIMSSNHKVSEGHKALRKEIDALAQKPVSEAELTKAKNQIIANILRERETNNGTAFEIGQSVVVEHDAAAVNKDIRKLQAVTPGDVKRVVETYLVKGKPTLIDYESQPGGGAK